MANFFQGLVDQFNQEKEAFTKLGEKNKPFQPSQQSQEAFTNIQTGAKNLGESISSGISEAVSGRLGKRIGDKIANILGVPTEDELEKTHPELVRAMHLGTAVGLSAPQEVGGAIMKIAGRATQLKAPQVSLGELPTTPPKGNLETLNLPLSKSVTEPPSIVKPPIGRGNITPPELDFPQWRDKGALSLARETTERNIEQIAPAQDAVKVKNFLIDPIRANETARVEFNNALRKNTKDFIGNLGIKAGSKEDALVQAFGEGSISIDELKSLTPKWQEVQQTSQFFRQKYDDLLDVVNGIRGKFGYNDIPKRKDYFRHFQELDGLIKNFGLIFKQEDLPTEISGLTEFFKPGKPFSTAELQRKGGQFTLSAIRGFDNYIDSISRQIFHIDSVQRARTLEKYIRQAGETNQANLPNFVANLKEYGNLLAGKKAQFDRAFEGLFGRKFYVAMNTIRSRTGANMIGGNISSAFTNFIPFTQSIATTEKPSALRGFMDAALSPFNKNFTEVSGTKSDFLTRRYPIERIAPTFGEKVKGGLGWLFQAIDKFTAKGVVAGKFYENLNKGIEAKEAMKLADDYAGKLITDRSLGQLPNLFGIRTTGALTQFQTEINNMYSFLVKDIPQMASGNKLKVVSALGQFVAYSYIYNQIFQQLTGRRPTLDPVHFLLVATNEAHESPRNRNIGNITNSFQQDIASNLPFVGGITGGRLPISAGLPNVPALLQGKTRLGQELAKPAFFLGPPAGGLQLKKSLQGLSAFEQGKVTSRSGKADLFKVQQTPENLLRMILFGKFSTPEAQKFFRSKK